MSYNTAVPRYEISPIPGKHNSNHGFEKTGNFYGSYAPNRLTNPPPGYPVPTVISLDKAPPPLPVFKYGFEGPGQLGRGNRQPQFEYGGCEQTGYRGIFNRQQYSAWQQHKTAHYPEIYSATSAGQNPHAGYYEQEPQQYAPFQFQPQSYRQYTPYVSQQNLAWLMQQWQAANNVSPPRPPFPPPLLPTARFDANTAAIRLQQPQKSVTAADLYRSFCVDKESRYHQNKLKPNVSNRPAISGANLPPPPPGHQNYYNKRQKRLSASGKPPAVNFWMGKNVDTTATRGAQTQQSAQPVNPVLSSGSQDPAARSFPQIQEKVKLRILPRPEPSLTYTTKAERAPKTMDVSRPLLIVLDLNGTLLHRSGGASFVGRPRAHEFLHYLLNNTKVMIWSSARPENVENMCQKLFTKVEYEKLVAIWARDKLRLPFHAYKANAQVYKQLSWVWSTKGIQSSHPDPLGLWSQENTVLIDDSMEKAASEPYNLMQIDEFEGKQEQVEVDVLGQVVKYLDTLRSEQDVSAYMREKPFQYKPGETFDWTPIVDDMH